MAKKIDFAALGKNQLKNGSSMFLSNEERKAQLIELEELRAWIPTPTDDELKQLEANLMLNGCRDALIVWDTTHGKIYPDSQTPDAFAYVIVDGHNRYRICKKRNIDFRIQLMEFPDLKSVKDFMIDLQLGRRNLTPQQIQYFRGLRYINEKGSHGGDRHSNLAAQNGQKTVEILAKDLKVSTSTIIRDGQFAEGLQKMTPSLQQAILNGNVKVSKKQIAQLGKAHTEKPIERLEEIEVFTNQEVRDNHVDVNPENDTSDKSGVPDSFPVRQAAVMSQTRSKKSLIPENPEGAFKQLLERLLGHLNEGKRLEKVHLQQLTSLIEQLNAVS